MKLEEDTDLGDVYKYMLTEYTKWKKEKKNRVKNLKLGGEDINRRKNEPKKKKKGGKRVN